MVNIKRAYENPSDQDEFRVLVDRLWPRGISKADAKIDAWLREIAPSNQLRKWYAHDPKKWEEFQKRYKKELESNKEPLRQLQEIIKKEKTVTLIYAAKDQVHNNATVLLSYLV
jgi:uncharacterized protein YeaO (DUF488 family)